MGSNTVVELNGRKVRGRLYPWGIVEGSYLVLLSGPLRGGCSGGLAIGIAM